MKNSYFIFLCLLFFSQKLGSQSKIIHTKPLFLRIAPDARSSSLADIGVATQADTFSQYWNPAKYPFSKSYSGVAFSYSPYLREITKDTYLLYGGFYFFLNEIYENTLATSIYYYKGGKAYLTEYQKHLGKIIHLGESNAYEFYVDFSYAMKLTDYYSMALAIRYVRSDPFNNLSTISQKFADYKAANSVSMDLAGYFEWEKKSYRNFEGVLHLGFNLNNIGPKLNYYMTNDDKSLYFPTNLKIGGVYDFLFDKENKLSLGIELNKLLVPSADENGIMPSKGVIEGIFSSFYDAPGGLKEELQEITYSIGLEYSMNYLRLRSGYFHEFAQKGGRKHISLGLGILYEEFALDLSYLIATSDRKLANHLKISLSWDFGELIHAY